MPDILKVNNNLSLTHGERKALRSLGRAVGTDQAVSLHGLGSRASWLSGVDSLVDKGLAEKVQGAAGYSYRLTPHGRRILTGVGL